MAEITPEMQAVIDLYRKIYERDRVTMKIKMRGIEVITGVAVNCRPFDPDGIVRVPGYWIGKSVKIVLVE